jgi:hypothetical protein
LLAQQQPAMSPLTEGFFSEGVISASGFFQESSSQSQSQTHGQSPEEAPVPKERNPENSASLEGTLVSASRQTMVVRTNYNKFHLFVFDTDLEGPKGLAPGVHVRVLSSSMDEPGVRVATRISVLESAPASQPETPPDVAPPPTDMIALQRDIETHGRLSVENVTFKDLAVFSLAPLFAVVLSATLISYLMPPPATPLS